MIMNQTMYDDYLKSIEEYVIDEGKIVTFKWLSRKLNIHINTAKQLLHSFLSTRGKSHADDISSMHQVSGVKEDGSLLISIVSDKQVAEIVSSFQKILSQHVYSIQKAKEVDGMVLYAVDTIETTSSMKSTISCSESIVKENLPPAPIPVVKTSKPAVAAKVEKKSPEKKAAVPTKKESPKKVEQKKTTVVKDPTKDNKKNAISAMFSAQIKKPKVEKKVVVEEEKEEEVTEKKVEKHDTKKEDSKKEVQSKGEKKESKKKEVKSNEAKKRGKKKEEAEVEKKRKRIRVFSDSEDSDEEANKERSPSPCEPDTEEAMEVAPVDINAEEEEEIAVEAGEGEATGSTHKRKKRKIIDVLEMTEEGYMETKKKVVYKTDSEDEGVEIVKTEVKPPQLEKKASTSSITAKKDPTPPNSSSPKKGKAKKAAAVADGKKQSSLLSFFKKS